MLSSIEILEKHIEQKSLLVLTKILLLDIFSLEPISNKEF